MKNAEKLFFKIELKLKKGNLKKMWIYLSLMPFINFQYVKMSFISKLQ